MRRKKQWVVLERLRIGVREVNRRQLRVERTEGLRRVDRFQKSQNPNPSDRSKMPP